VPWSADALYRYLRHGHAPEHGMAAGPMTAVVQQLAQVPDADVRAMATYLASFNPPATDSAALAQQLVQRAADQRSALVGSPGQRMFDGACSACHHEGDGPKLLGVRVVIARSFERIHRSNLVGMGVLPLQFRGTDSWQSLGLRGDEMFDIELAAHIAPQQEAKLVITSTDGNQKRVPLTLRIDTPIEVDYYQHGGILPFVLRQLLAS
jgi:hypothetical protein